MTQTNICLYINNIQFCSIWKSNGINFNKAVQDMKLNFIFLDTVISDKHVKVLLNMNMVLKKSNLHQLIILCMV